MEWLETVLAVAKAGSFNEAAEAVSYAQSSVSRHVKSAERELGITIFQRSSNSNVVRLTEAGSALLPDIERTLKAYTTLCQKVALLNHQRQLPLTLGVDSNTFSAAAKARLLALLYADAPEIILTVDEFPVVAREDALISGKADALLFARAYPIHEEPSLTLGSDLLKCVFLGRVPLSIAFGEKRAPKQASISLSQLAHQSFFFHTNILESYDPERVQTRHQMLIQALLAQGIEPQIKIVDRHLADIKLTLTAQGKGIFPSTIPAFLRDYPGICYLPVSDAPYYIQYYLLSLYQNKNPALQTLTNFLLKWFSA